MKILILGTGKSGTTALVFKIAGGLPNCRAFSGGKPGKYLADYENAVYKHTYNPLKGKTFDLYEEHLKKEKYDRKIWMARDPRDVAISRMLYRWQRGVGDQKEQYLAHLNLVMKKEKNPASVSFCEVYRYSGFGHWPLELEEFIEEETNRYKQMCEYVANLGNDWQVYTYEEMIDNSFDRLQKYLGFEVLADAKIPVETGKSKVIRKKSTGDWRSWFTEADVQLLKSAYLPYMELIGYDKTDWALNSEPVIEPEYSSGYMQRLVQRANPSKFVNLKDRIFRRVFGFEVAK